MASEAPSRGSGRSMEPLMPTFQDSLIPFTIPTGSGADDSGPSQVESRGRIVQNKANSTESFKFEVSSFKCQVDRPRYQAFTFHPTGRSCKTKPISGWHKLG